MFNNVLQFMEQIIENAKLRLVSSGGIKAMLRYSGYGRLDIDEKGFQFEEKRKHAHTRNVRINKGGAMNDDSIFYLVNDGRFRITLFVETDKLNLKALSEQLRPLIAEAKKGGYQ